MLRHNFSQDKPSLLGRSCAESITYTLQNNADFLALYQEPSPVKLSPELPPPCKADRLLVGCLFSRIIGNNFPLSVYLSQSIFFHREVGIGEEVVGEVRVAR